MTNFHAMIPGGFYSKTPADMTIKRSIRANNPWAINWAAWQEQRPGYAGMTGADNSPAANKTSIWETPEQGVAMGWELLRKYAARGVRTVEQILTAYGGSNQDYSAYLDDVVKRSGLSKTTVIDLDNDAQLLKLARAMFRYEAGETSPLSDAQILFGFAYARELSKTGKELAPPSSTVANAPRPPGGGGLFDLIAALFSMIFGGKKFAPNRHMKRGDTSPAGDTNGDVWQLQVRLHKDFADLNIDGDFGEATETAVRRFQSIHNIDPSGVVDKLTIAALNEPPKVAKPPLLPANTTKAGKAPSWYVTQEKWIGFHEVGNNRGIETFIDGGKCGQLGDPYCAIFQNFGFETNGVPGTRSPAAYSFEVSPNFIKIDQPCLGCVVTMWRGTRRSPGQAGNGHVFSYDGENAHGVRGIGANEEDEVKRSFHDRGRIVGYYWPKSVPLPRLGPIFVNDDGSLSTKET